jgi:predicted amidohydrolase YtcJ
MHVKMVDCDLRSIDAIKRAIRERCAITPKGKWVKGFKYDDTKTAEGRPLTLADLDEAAPEHPVNINHRGGTYQLLQFNSFQMAGVDESTPNPVGGEFEKRDGKLTGCVKESAMMCLKKLIRIRFAPGEAKAGVKLISQMMAKTGHYFGYRCTCSYPGVRCLRGSICRWRFKYPYLLHDLLYLPG